MKGIKKRIKKLEKRMIALEREAQGQQGCIGVKPRIAFQVPTICDSTPEVERIIKNLCSKHDRR